MAGALHLGCNGWMDGWMDGWDGWGGSKHIGVSGQIDD